MTKNLIIMAGGASSRMKRSSAVEGLSKEELAAANSSSKALIAYGAYNRPLLDALLINARDVGLQNIFIIIGEQIEAFKKFYSEENIRSFFPEMEFRFATQFVPKNRSKPLGTADALQQCLEQFPILKKQSFIVCNSDNLYSEKALKTLAKTNSSNAFISYDRDELLFSSERIARFALVRLDKANYMKEIVEKPELEEVPKMKDAQGKLRVSMNIWRLAGDSIFPFLVSCELHPERNEKELPGAIQNMIQRGKVLMKGYPLSEHVPDLTYKEDISQFKSFLSNMD